MNGISLGEVSAAVASTSVAKPTVWEQINKGLQVVQTGANIYTQVKGSNAPGSPSNAPGSPSASTVYPTPSTTPTAEPASNTKKYLLIGGVVLLAGTGIYFATRKKKGKK